jgi:hypothetical protein
VPKTQLEMTIREAVALGAQHPGIQARATSGEGIETNGAEAHNTGVACRATWPSHAE